MYEMEDSKMYYKRRIIELIKGCNSERWLKAIYAFVKKLLEQR